MKRLFIFTIITLFSVTVFAQQIDLRRKISVSGTAETEVTPDIIYISISLKEYLKDGNSKKKIDITDLENQLYNAVLKAGIPKENLMINNLSGYNYVLEKKKNPDYLASKQYRLKVGDLNKWNEIIGSIDPKGVQYTNIESYDYSKLESLKKELKIKAVLAAKAKASYMVEALGDKLGGVIDIQDLGDGNVQQPVYRNYMMKTEAVAMDSAAASELNFKKIKLSFTVNTVFEIK